MADARGRLVTPLQPGDPRRLGRWRLEGRLGAGGMGVVYLARRRRAQRVAIKIPRVDLARDPEFRERFRREAEAASAVAARCTARVLEVHSEGARPYIVTEYVDGPTLHAAVTAEGPLTGPDLVAFAVGVAEAMVAMHAAGVTHRDLTPGNVILGRWGPKVIDFGIARADDAATLTQTGMRIGTPAWMAPEQARGDRVGPAADTFSWGTLVAYAGLGRHPFGNGRVDAVLYRIVHESPDLVGLEPALAPLVERALDKNPAGRPAPGDLLDALTPIEARHDAAVASAATVPASATRVMTAPPAPPRSSPRRVPSTPPVAIAPRPRPRPR
ncbi:MAG: serine/threonine-protein kinase, partial [Acidimicrobiia bacterium]